MQESMHTMRGSMAMMRDMHSGKGCNNMGMSGTENGGMGMMDMMMKMLDQQSSMMNMQMSK